MTRIKRIFSFILAKKSEVVSVKKAMMLLHFFYGRAKIASALQGLATDNTDQTDLFCFLYSVFYSISVFGPLNRQSNNTPFFCKKNTLE
jgi:hypothetical protein